MPKRDGQATEAKRFKCKDSFVFKDGREWLEGRDWDERRFELLQRSRGQCEFWYDADQPDAHRCTRDASDPHHVIPRGNHGLNRDDRLSNLKALCRPHHGQMHAGRQPRWTKRSA